MKPNIAERIAEIRKMLAAATPGPWMYEETDDGHVIRMGEAIESPYFHDSHLAIEYDHGCYYDDDDDEESETGNKQSLEAEANAQLIAKAPETIETLIGEVERQAEEIKRLQELSVHQILVENGGINFHLSGEPGKNFMAVLIKFFQDNGAKNFFEMTVEMNGERYSITFKNLNGQLSPAEKMANQEAEIERLRKALKFYGDENNYHRRQKDAVFFHPAPIEDDLGHRAREALKEGE